MSENDPVTNRFCDDRHKSLSHWVAKLEKRIDLILLLLLANLASVIGMLISMILNK